MAIESLTNDELKKQLSSIDSNSSINLSDEELIKSINPQFSGSIERAKPSEPVTQVDLYSNDEPSFLDSLASADTAFFHGLAAVPDKIAYDIDSTVSGIAHSLGLVSTQTYNKHIKNIKSKLGESIDQSNPDVQRFPGLAQNTQDIGALVAESIGVGKAAGLVGKGIQAAVPAIESAGRLGQGIYNTLSTAGQAGAIGALQGDPGKKAQTAGISAALAGGISATANLATAGVSKLLGANKSPRDLAQTIQNQNAVEAQTGVPLSMNQRTGAHFGEQYTKAQSSIQQAVSKDVPDIQQVVEGSTLKAQGEVIKAFRFAEKQAKETADDLYKTWATKADDSIGPISASNSMLTGASLQTDITLRAGEFGKAGKSSVLTDLIKRAEALDNTTPSQIYKLRQDINVAKDNLFKKGIKTTSDRAVIESLVKLRSAVDDDLQHAAIFSHTIDDLNAAQSYWKNNVLALNNAKLHTEKGVSQIGPLMKYLKDPVKTEAAKATLEALGSKGQQAIRTNIATEALEGALDGTGNLDINTFTKNYRTALNQFDLIYKTEDKPIIEGLSRIIKAGKIPMKGTPIIGTQSELRPIINIIKKLTDSPTGQDILLAIGRMPARDPKVNQSINSLYRLATDVQTGLSAATASTITNEPTPSLINQTPNNR